MIIKKFYKTRKDGINLYKTYSDEFLKIKNIDTNILYDEAIDIENNNFSYIETDIPIKDELDDSQALKLLLGAEFDEIQ